MLTLRDAAEYVRTSKASQALLAALKAIKRVFSFTEERQNRMGRYVAVINAYQGGMPIEDILTKFGCSKRTLYDYIERAGIPRRSFIPAEVKEKIIADYRRKIPVKKIAELHSVSLRYVMQVSNEAGLRRKKSAHS